MQTSHNQNDIAFFAKTNFRDELRPFGIKRFDRRGHIYILGKTGTGKSTLLETLMMDDVSKARGFAILDPHGDLVKKVRDQIPEELADRVIDFDIADPDQPYGFNPLAGVHERKRPLAASGLMQVFKHLWADSWGPRLEYILRNCLLALLDFPGSTLLDIQRILMEENFRAKVVKFVRDDLVRKFWEEEYAQYADRFRIEAISPIQNKVGAFLSNSYLRKLITNPDIPLNLRRAMDEGKIVLVNLSKGSIGEDTSNLLGSLLISRFDLAAVSRADLLENERRDFTLYLDEFHNFTTQSLIFMLSELRKYRLSLVLAHQYLAQLDRPIREAILGNAGTIISFRLGASDAEILAPEFAPEFTATDFTNIANFHVFLKLLIDGKVSSPFTAITLPPPAN